MTNFWQALEKGFFKLHENLQNLKDQNTAKHKKKADRQFQLTLTRGILHEIPPRKKNRRKRSKSRFKYQKSIIQYMGESL